MIKKEFSWHVSHTPNLDTPPTERIEATVPGAIGLDYARAKNYPPYYYGNNYELFLWMENEYFVYDTELDFTVKDGERAFLNFLGIDYEYSIRIDGKEYKYGEGYYAPTKLDVTSLSGKKSRLEVIIYPAPKDPTARRKNTRDEAQSSHKPPSTYGWDWHPRLIPSGIWKEAFLEITSSALGDIYTEYKLSDDLKHAQMYINVNILGKETVNLKLLAPGGEVVYERVRECPQAGNYDLSFGIDSPLLWYPRGYGEQPVYTLVFTAGEKTVTKKIGFRRVKLQRNADDVWWEREFPKPRLPAPATIEVNGKKVFAKGSNWVNVEIFPALMTDERYDELLDKVAYANMNILRIWGGQYYPHDHFYDKCDEYGIMVWQEFTLSCNRYPDDDKYLSVLKNEATALIENLRTHPSLTLWCGGNELFNSWSGMTDQSHPLRLLNHLCYDLDRFTPYNSTSPVAGMAHGNYVTLYEKKKAGIDIMGLGAEIDCDTEAEFITVLSKNRYTAYTEFGSSGGAYPEYIKKYIMSEEDYANRSPKNPVWVSHHAYHAWGAERWICEKDSQYYFNDVSLEDTDKILTRSLDVQAISYQSLFEEMRRQWPVCSMAINWDFNEPWPCIAGNSLLNWPCEPKPALESVREALRPLKLSVKTDKNRFLAGERAEAEIWILNDTDDAREELEVDVYLEGEGTRKLVGTAKVPECPARENRRGESVTLDINDELGIFFGLSLESKTHPEMNASYKFIKK